MTRQRYLTLAGSSTGMLREKASKFIAIAFPVATEDEFKSMLRAFEREHSSAKHFCFAWVMGIDGENHRAYDAGEPNGTAGRPILRRIASMDLTYCGVIVVRYFGGTLLGKAGLVHAYGDAAQLALDAATIIEHVVMEQATLTCGYDRFEQIKSEVINSGGLVTGTLFGENCTVRFSIPIGEMEPFRERWNALGVESVKG